MRVSCAGLKGLPRKWIPVAAKAEGRFAIYCMLEDWVEYHVRNADRQLVSFLREPGV